MGTKITIDKGGYGISIPITIESKILQVGDILTLIVRDDTGGTALITKDYTIDGLTDNSYTIDFSLTEEDSNKLDVGFYVWGRIRRCRKKTCKKRYFNAELKDIYKQEK